MLIVNTFFWCKDSSNRWTGKTFGELFSGKMLLSFLHLVILYACARMAQEALQL